MADDDAYQMLETFVLLGDDRVATPLPVTESFWPDLVGGKWDHLGPGRLVSCYEFDQDWDSWEVHPQGDEFVCVLSGAADFVFDLPEGHKKVTLRGPGAFLLVPRGTWHTAHTNEPCRALFVTAGLGTEHRPA